MPVSSTTKAAMRNNSRPLAGTRARRGRRRIPSRTCVHARVLAGQAGSGTKSASAILDAVERARETLSKETSRTGH